MINNFMVCEIKLVVYVTTVYCSDESTRTYKGGLKGTRPDSENVNLCF